jgi:nucleoside-diphosphate-sugar epimerase
MKVAVTGAAGRLGKYVVQELLEHGHEVKGLSLMPAAEIAIPQVAVDITEFDQVFKGLDECEAIIHLAAIPTPYEKRPNDVLMANTIGTNNVLQAAIARKIKRIACASSDSAFGLVFSHNEALMPDYLPMDERHPDRPNDYYGLSKVFSEQICDALAVRNPGISFTSLRISMIIEPQNYAQPRFVSMHTDPRAGSRNLWSFLDSRDAARAFRLAVEQERPGHEKILVAADEQRNQLASMELIKTFFPQVELRREFKDHECLLDCAKALRLLGFKPLYRWGGEAR